MRSRIPIIVIAAVTTVMLAACGGDDASDDTTTMVLAGDTTTTVASDGSTSVTTTSAFTEPVISGAEPIEQLSATSGGGARPLLEWAPVAGAATYIVIVYTAGGEPYWSAITTEPQVFIGGPLQIPEGRDGPIVDDGYTWAVYADDAEGTLLAASALRDISP